MARLNCPLASHHHNLVLGLCLTPCHCPKTMAMLASDVVCWWDLGVWHYPMLFPTSLPAEFELGLGSKPLQFGNPEIRIGGTRSLQAVLQLPTAKHTPSTHHVPNT